MRFNQLAHLFYDWGWEIKHEAYVAFSDYLKEMLKRNRVITVMNGDAIEAVLFFYLTNDYRRLYRKPTWAIVEDEPEGSQIYIDKMVCKKFTKELHIRLAQAIEERFPQVVEAFYHRAPFDRCIKIRRKNELSDSVSKR